MHHIAIAKSTGYVDHFEANTLEELAREIARENGGHHALEPDATISVYSGKASITAQDGDRFWLQIISDCMSDRDNDEWFLGDSREDVAAQADEWLNPID